MAALLLACAVSGAIAQEEDPGIMGPEPVSEVLEVTSENSPALVPSEDFRDVTIGTADLVPDFSMGDLAMLENAPLGAPPAPLEPSGVAPLNQPMTSSFLPGSNPQAAEGGPGRGGQTREAVAEQGRALVRQAREISPVVNDTIDFVKRPDSGPALVQRYLGPPLKAATDGFNGAVGWVADQAGAATSAASTGASRAIDWVGSWF